VPAPGVGEAGETYPEADEPYADDRLAGPAYEQPPARPSRTSFPEAPSTASSGGAFTAVPPSLLNAPVPPVAPPAPPRRSPLLFVGVAIGAAAIAVAVMYLAMRGGGGDGKGGSGSAPVATGPDATAAAPPPTPTNDAAAAQPAATDAAIAAGPADAAVATAPADAAVVAVVPADAAPKTRPDAAQRSTSPDRPPPDARPATPEDPAVAEALRDAQGALARGDRGTANLRSQFVINSPDASPVQIAYARAVAGILECIKDDIGNAKAQLRQIALPAARSQLIAGCRAHGHPTFEP
jgi:hypothetical protein